MLHRLFSLSKKNLSTPLACLPVGLILLIFYMILSKLFLRFTHNSFFLMMQWNTFLGFIPLAFAALTAFFLKKKHFFLSLITGTVWLLFFPNAHYMITDFIHLGSIKFYENGIYFYELTNWLFLFYIAFGMVLSLICGVASLDIIFCCLKQKYNCLIAVSAILIVSYLSGYAVYIGRFIRLNSWDILRPVFLLRTMLSQINYFSICFTFLMGTYILFTFAAYRLIRSGT